jgi:hypothetical protein
MNKLNNLARSWRYRAENSHQCLLQQVTNKDKQINRLSKTSNTFIDNVCKHADWIQKIIEDTLYERLVWNAISGRAYWGDMANSDLWQFTVQAAKEIHTVSIYPYKLESDSKKMISFPVTVGSEPHYVEKECFSYSF